MICTEQTIGYRPVQSKKKKKKKGQIKSAITDDQAMFQNIDTVSLATVDRVLRRNELRMKQVYRVPFERNSDSVKQLRHDYVQVSPIYSHN